MFLIEQAEFPKDTNRVLEIFREYIGSAPVSLDYQKNDEEFKQLAEKYSLPNGIVFLILKNDEVVGCGAFRRIDENVCEMKRVSCLAQKKAVIQECVWMS